MLVRLWSKMTFITLRLVFVLTIFFVGSSRASIASIRDYYDYYPQQSSPYYYGSVHPWFYPYYNPYLPYRYASPHLPNTASKFITIIEWFIQLNLLFKSFQLKMSNIQSISKRVSLAVWTSHRLSVSCWASIIHLCLQSPSIQTIPVCCRNTQLALQTAVRRVTACRSLFVTLLEDRQVATADTIYLYRSLQLHSLF